MTPQTKSSSWAVLCLSVVQTLLCKAFGIFRVQQVGRSDLKWSDFETLRALQQTRPQFASFDKVADFLRRSCLNFYIMGKPQSPRLQDHVCSSNFLKDFNRFTRSLTPIINSLVNFTFLVIQPLNGQTLADYPAMPFILVYKSVELGDQLINHKTKSRLYSCLKRSLSPKQVQIGKE